jgi:hypothetical protein
MIIIQRQSCFLQPRLPISHRGHKPNPFPMKSIVHLLIILVSFVLPAFAAPSAQAEEPKTLEEALKFYMWSWKDLGTTGVGTWTTTMHFDKWSITGPLTIRLDGKRKDGKTGYAVLTFSKDLASYKGIAYNLSGGGPKVNIIGIRKERITENAVPATADSIPSSASSSLTPRITTHKSDETKISILSEESVNVTGWITSPLDVAVPEQIWENLNFLKEALKDEAAQKPSANAACYTLGVRLCLKMLENLADRDTDTARAGGDAKLHQKYNLTQQNRDHLTWPQYALERDERAERTANAKLTQRQIGVMNEWANKTNNMRKDIQFLYSQFRDALRQAPVAK